MIAGTQWANVELDNTNNTWTVQAGQAFQFQVRYRNSLGTNILVTEFGLDDDATPYNNTQANVFLRTTNFVDASVSWIGTRSWTPKEGDNRKFLYARITDYKGLVRYHYLSSRLTVIPIPTLTISRSANNVVLAWPVSAVGFVVSVVGTIGIIEKAGAAGLLDAEGALRALQVTTFFGPEDLIQAALTRAKKSNGSK